jgi:MFS family permease
MHAWRSAAARGFESLRVRNFRLFWIGQVISVTGTWMQTTAQAWLVLKLTDDSPLALGTVIALQFTPVMLFALYGGVLADRLPKRRTLVNTRFVDASATYSPFWLPPAIPFRQVISSAQPV